MKNHRERQVHRLRHLRQRLPDDVLSFGNTNGHSAPLKIMNMKGQMVA